MSRSYFLYLSQGNKKALNKYLQDSLQNEHDATSMVISAIRIQAFDMVYYLLEHECVPQPDWIKIFSNLLSESKKCFLQELIINDKVPYNENLKEQIKQEIKSLHFHGSSEYEELLAWLEAHELYKKVSASCEQKPNNRQRKKI